MEKKEPETVSRGGGGPDHPANDLEPQVRYLNLSQAKPGMVVNGRYRVERMIGKGGFGMVFAGFDLTLKARVALKFFDPAFLQDEKKFLRVQREINLSRKAGDPRIVRIFSLENWSGIWFMVMELIESRTLKDLLKEKGRFAWEEFRPVFLEILQGVGTLHGQGIIHRDLKPSNITVDPDGKIKILDFGLAKEIGDLEKTSSVGEVVGSPFYLSPEQIQGRELGVESDVYQLGILLFQALTGTYPFPDTTTMGLVLMHLNQEPGRIADRGIEVPGVVEFVIARALAKKKQDRFRSAAEMAERLRRGGVPLLHSLARRIPRFCRIAAVAAASLFLVASAYVKTYGSRQIGALAAEGTAVRALNRFGRTVWKKDFAPFTVHIARIARGPVPENLQDQQNPIRFVNDSLLATLPFRPSPLVLVFLSHPGKGVFARDGSVNSDRFDNRLAVLDAQGRLIGQEPYGKAFDLQPYDFAPVYTMSGYREVGEGGERLSLFHLQNFQGMYPSAQVALQGTTFAVLCSPGSIQDVRVIRNIPSEVSLLVLGADNPLSHLAYLTEMSFSPGRYHNAAVLPDYFHDINQGPDNFLVFLPRRCKIIGEHWLDGGRVVLFDDQDRKEITVYRDGRLAVDDAGAVSTFKDDPVTLALAYGLINEFFQQKTVRRNPEKALEIAARAAALPVQNPYLRSALLCLHGESEAALGRYAAAKRSLEKALSLFPRNNDAIGKILEIAFFEKGPQEAIAMLEHAYSHGQNLYGLGDAGNYLFAGYAHLAAGQAEKGRDYFEKIFQLYFPDSRETLQGIMEMFQGDYGRALKLFSLAEDKTPGFFDIRELRLLLARSMVLTGTDPARARWILEDLAKFSLRQGHMAEISLCYLLAREGKTAEVRERIGPVFERLKKTAIADFETRLWFWYDAFIYARTMEILGNPGEARKGYRACLEANPHAALAGEARKALARQ
jgi:tRNA A-37 threonylcarbamoyl transferase component Bud32/tetratricopeptide (TPR) repeat protein